MRSVEGFRPVSGPASRGSWRRLGGGMELVAKERGCRIVARGWGLLTSNRAPPHPHAPFPHPICFASRCGAASTRAAAAW